MADAPSAELISGTQNTLGKFVKRPPLTEKLLKKPPFRFLHDIITSVLKSNGFFEGLFEEAELISENVKDREAKILFLTKVISVLSLTTGKSLTAKPAKIISGQEPEKTNELLLCLGLALEQNLSTEEAVTKYKQNLKTSHNNENTKKSHEESVNKPPPKYKENGISTSKSRDKLVKSKDKKESTVTKKDTNKRDTSISKKDVPKNRREPSLSRHDAQKEKKETHKDENRERSKDKDKPLTKERSREKVSKTSPPKPASTHKNISGSNPKINAADNQAVALNMSSELDRLDLVTGDSFEKQEGIIKPPDETEFMDPENNDYSESNLLQNGVIRHDNKENIESVTTINPPMKPMTENEIFHSVDNNSLSSSNHLQNNGSPSTDNDHNDRTSDENVEVTHTEYSRPTEFHEIPMSDSKSNNYEMDNIPDRGTEVSVKKTSNEMARNESVPEGNKPSTPMVSTRRNILRPPTARPPSARPGAPRLREKRDDVLAPTDAVPMSKVNVIVENGDPDADEDETSLVFVEPAAEQQTGGDSEANVAMHHSFADHGHLVQQILDSQKEFSQMQTGKTDIEWEFGAQRAREASSQEVEQLRVNLQALSRAANPLGKLLDHIQEDVEVMRQELQQWTKTYEDATTELAKQKSGTEQALQPLQAKSRQLDEEIMDKRDKINDLKSIIHKNSTRINKLLASGNVQ